MNPLPVRLYTRGRSHVFGRTPEEADARIAADAFTYDMESFARGELEAQEEPTDNPDGSIRYVTDRAEAERLAAESARHALTAPRFMVEADTIDELLAAANEIAHWGPRLEEQRAGLRAMLTEAPPVAGSGSVTSAPPLDVPTPAVEDTPVRGASPRPWELGRYRANVAEWVMTGATLPHLAVIEALRTGWGEWAAPPPLPDEDQRERLSRLRFALGYTKPPAALVDAVEALLYPGGLPAARPVRATPPQVPPPTAKRFRWGLEDAIGCVDVRDADTRAELGELRTTHRGVFWELAPGGEAHGPVSWPAAIVAVEAALEALGYVHDGGPRPQLYNPETLKPLSEHEMREALDAARAARVTS